ncbi:MAG: hypothetical protein EAZ85_13630, partial [Bacteroidetes bacterium]
LRNLSSTFQKTIENNMAITLNFNIEEDIFYKQGIEKGIEKGTKQGVEKGINEGEAKKAKSVVINCIQKGFDNQTISELTGLSIPEIEKIRKELKK